MATSFIQVAMSHQEFANMNESDKESEEEEEVDE